MDIIDASDDDRISKLPEPILQHILSFLHAEDAARMSTLSKVLLSAWNSLPYLVFGDHIFRRSERNPHVAIDQILANRKRHNNISIKRFTLWLGSHPGLSYVDEWINILIACNIKEVNLRINRYFHQGNVVSYSLPKVIFAANSLNVLSLAGFKIELPPDDGGMIKFSSLRELHLSYVFLDEQSIKALCTNCPNLECLSLRSFAGLTSFQVGETLPKLKKVNLVTCEHRPCLLQLVDVAAINLEDLVIYGNIYGNIKVVRINACKALKRLCLKDVDLADNWFEELFYSLQNLEKFDLICCKTLKTMKITSDSLKWLTVRRCDNLIAADFDTPNLLKFEYDRNPLPTFKLKASHLLEATFQLYSQTDGSDWHSKLITFLANFNHSKAIDILCTRGQDLVIPKYLRKNFLPPLYGTNILQVKVHHLFHCSLVDIVDCMLWISPRLDILSFPKANGLKTLKFIYEDASDEDEKPCCASLPWKCWRHTLKKVVLQNFSCTKQEELRTYFFTNADNLEMVEITFSDIFTTTTYPVYFHIVGSGEGRM